jgi:cell volume regulation protein A
MTLFKAKFRQQVFVAWTGMRGVASIVFAIVAITTYDKISIDIFHIVFFIVLFSILLQGTLLPFVAKKLNMIDYEEDVMKTFNDYLEEVPVQFIQFNLPKEHEWIGKKIREITLPPDSILVLVVRNGNKIIPNGNTKLLENDIMILSGKDSSKIDGINLNEKLIEAGDPLVDKKIKDVSIVNKLIILIKRGNSVIIPKGDTVIHKDDVLVINDTK